MKKYTYISQVNLFLLFTLILTQALYSCTTTSTGSTPIKTGPWRAVLTTQGQQIPFLMEATKQEDKTVLYLINGEERILLDDVKPQDKDSLKIPMHIFHADLIVKANGNRMAGRYVKNDAPTYYAIPFTAEHGKTNRFSEKPEAATYNYNGKWEVTFTNKEGRKTKAVGVFEQKENYLTGTFLTETGDYRFLEGQVSGDKLSLSTFDGSHIYLIKAAPADAQTIKGEFFSGIGGYSTWTGTRNEAASLANPDSLTFLKEGYDALSFTFPNLEGKPISLSDPRYKNKVVVVQLLGSWCPNCMDETAYLAPFYKENKSRGLEIIGLGFERSPVFENAAARLQRLKDRFDIKYELLVAGTTEQGAAAAALPALNHVMSFPTTIIIDKKGKVRKIHTGFSGPGTGQYYEEWVADFNKTIDQLLAEK